MKAAQALEVPKRSLPPWIVWLASSVALAFGTPLLIYFAAPIWPGAPVVEGHAAPANGAPDCRMYGFSVYVEKPVSSLVFHAQVPAEIDDYLVFRGGESVRSGIIIAGAVGAGFQKMPDGKCHVHRMAAGEDDKGIESVKVGPGLVEVRTGRTDAHYISLEITTSGKRFDTTPDVRCVNGSYRYDVGPLNVPVDKEIRFIEAGSQTMLPSCPRI